MRFLNSFTTTVSRTHGTYLVAMLFLCSTLSGLCSEAFAADPASNLEALEEQAVKQSAAALAGSLVRIETVGGLDRVGEMLTGTGPTTGIVVGADGYIISSSFNFASKPSSILVTLGDGRRLAATLVATDRLKMLTLLKVDAKDLPVPQAATEPLRVGQTAIALGKTYDEQLPTVSVGIISALGRIWGKAIQTDAKVSPVNYGGALADLDGKVLGVIVPLSPQATGELAGVEWYDGGIGFAIPFPDVLKSLDRLKGGKDLYPGLLGIYLKGSDIYEGEPAIDRMRFGAPAEAAGLKVGDVITEMDGKPIVRHAQMLHVLGNKYAGDKVAIKARRGKEDISATVTLVEKLDPYEPPYLGVLPVREAAKAREDGKPAATGLTLRLVLLDSPAAKGGLQKGDRILKAGNADVTDAASLLDQVNRKRPGEKLTLTVDGAGGHRVVDVTLAKMPDKLPNELPSVAIPSPEKPAAGAKPPKTGRISDRIATHEHDYWAYVPDDYNPAHSYALVVWLHPAGDTHEAAMMKVWKPLCDEKGIILLSPKAKTVAGWNPSELEFIKDLVEQFEQTYRIDKSRVVVHSFSQSGTMAYLLAFKNRSLFTGICTVASPIFLPPPENEPAHRLQFYLLCGEKDPLQKAVSSNVKGLEKMKYPVMYSPMPGEGHKYPPAPQVRDIAKWIDLLDRI